MPSPLQPKNSFIAKLLEAYKKGHQNDLWDQMGGPMEFMEQTPGTEHMSLEEIIKWAKLRELLQRQQEFQDMGTENKYQRRLNQYDNLNTKPYQQNLIPNWKPGLGELM